jgi:hypothetical protein
MAIDSILANASAKVASAIRSAARSTGASFEYLLTAARIESNLNPAARATTSSAKGLYQFLDQTWLATLKQAGPAHGYGRYADAISLTADGRYEVADPVQRAAIMRLRGDPAASALMAGAFTQTNAGQLAAAIGRQPSEGELYIAHFLGANGAAKLISAAATQPRANAGAMFPQAAEANPSIFLNRFGLPRSAGEVYSTLIGRFADARTGAVARGLLGNMTAPAASPDTAGVTQAFAQANDVTAAAPRAEPAPQARLAPQARPFFQTMFSDRGNRAVAQTVVNLWTPADTPAATESSPMLNLFTDDPTGPRKRSPGKF